jgi:cytochrome c553
MMRILMTAMGLLLISLPAGAEGPKDPFPAERPPLFDPEFETPDQDKELVRQGLVIVSGGAERGGVEMKCMACHGVDGMGARIGSVPRLAGMSAGYLRKQMNAFRDGTRSSQVMTPIALGLSAREMMAVSAYYASIEAETLEGFPEADPAKVQQGGAVAATGIAEEDREITACTSCHVNAEGRSGETVPMLASQHATYIESQLDAWKTGMRRTDPLNVMKTIAETLTEEEIEAVALYYERLAPE